MNKKLLSLAIAGAVASGSAYGVNLTDTNGGTAQTAASELAISGTAGTNVSVGSITADVGFSMGSASRYMRFDLSGGTWAQQITTAMLTIDNSVGAAQTTGVLAVAAGGGTADSYVIFQVNAGGTATVVSANDVVFTPTNGIKVKSQSSVSVTYALFETATSASQNTSGGSLASDSGPLLAFAAANGTAANSVAGESNLEKIDVTQGSTYFDGGTNDTSSTIGAFTTTDSTGTQTNATGSAVGTAQVEANATVTVSGDFSFAQDLTNNAPDGTYTNTNVFLSASNACTVSAKSATSLNATTATFTNVTGTTTKQYICVTANGKSIIPEQTFTGSYVSQPNTGYSSETTSLTFGTLNKNGSSVTVNLALKPGGAFSNYIRIVNTSNVTGDVSFTMYNDSGDSVSGINLGDVSGQTTSELKAQGSTGVIKIDDMYAAAQAKDSTFDVGSGKLRLVIDGEFSSITAQSITLSTDNTSFTTF